MPSSRRAPSEPDKSLQALKLPSIVQSGRRVDSLASLNTDSEYKNERRSMVMRQRSQVMAMVAHRRRAEELQRRKERELEEGQRRVHDLAARIYRNAKIGHKSRPFHFANSLSEPDLTAKAAERAQRRILAQRYMEQANDQWTDKIKSMQTYVRSLRNPKKQKEETFFDNRAVLLQGDTVTVLPSLSGAGGISKLR